MRGRMMVATGVVGLLTLVSGGLSYIRQSRHEVQARFLDFSLTGKQLDAASTTARSKIPPAAAFVPVSAQPGTDQQLLSRQAAEYDVQQPKSPIALQRFRRATSIQIRGPGERKGIAVLIDLNPRINDWYILALHWSDGQETTLHLENTHPELQRIVLDPAFPSGLVVTGAGPSRPCKLWLDRVPDQMRDLAQDQNPYTKLCGGDILVRHRTRGSRTSREWAADFLRSNVFGGEELTVLVRKTVYADAFLEKAELAAGETSGHRTINTRMTCANGMPQPADESTFPRPALVNPPNQNDRLVSRDLGISIPGEGAMVVGRWYPAIDTPGVFVSLMTPGHVAHEVLEKSRVHDLDVIERGALVYLIAFDLERFDLGFGLGTDNPGVGWSERAPGSMRELPGPDGFADLAPLAPTGLVPPQAADRVVATFAGGFKRLHCAFHSGALARINSGSHYGFIEGGAVLSKLQPGLSTLFALDDGNVVMKTWSRADDALLERVRFARQNGVPILERDLRTGLSLPGALVGRWTEGNWGGSQESKLRSVRAGAGIQESAGRRFLVYGYFSNTTPSAMALVFAAFGCRYAMHLDMNALEHTYLALYRSKPGKLDTEHLVRGMSVLDKTSGGTTIPRFLGFADNRDFFYLMRKRAKSPNGPSRPDVKEGSLTGPPPTV